MNTQSIAIVGAGLSGIYAAYLLEKAGVSNYQVLEASERLGGRIRSEEYRSSRSSSERLDLGAAWFWPHMQPELDDLVRSLRLKVYAQHEQGGMMVERSPETAPTRHAGYLSSPPSMRIEGGMLALVDRLSTSIASERIHLDRRVTAISATDAGVTLEVQTGSGEIEYLSADHVLLAIPPRLAATTIQFTPKLPSNVLDQWQNTATWMAPHAKYLAVYSTPFWRDEGLSGEARSFSGPMGEIHDASLPDGTGALFGFLGVPAHTRKRVSSQALQRLCRAQFVRLFGAKAAHPVAEWLVDWSQSSLTATSADEQSDGQHPIPPSPRVDEGPWRTRISGVASEWSQTYPGYVAGAVQAAQAAVHALLAARTPSSQASSSIESASPL
ncbi:flavin monoamine oxidase family protein [Delftia tsuruhatensis]|uniref:flavin monoamine oxidase family protein n=1 Tax=Delftia tsuruhatensis TaxID=180282 RepID=UPI0028B18794|nr:FAD-dependent oxidoreductase [Delftia tsuruhatensis]